MDVQVYKFSSNEYRFFPVTVSLNVCAEYFRNSCDVKTILARVSNMNLCNMKKGYYYIKDGLPDYSKFPPHIPRGLYKMSFEYKYYEKYYAKLDFYGEVKDKPIDWKKIPKRRN
ncbi:hypothetical protein ILUMI_05048 [Ignelater luminosus]|uniref:Uncharacterized protein n=1 Tax=Ignelater luminosus TaxID=2038154 RepID=A0A8K0GKH8_IGNLU|nr:hypothetical protein ILUMI_05048 [Ignelater luminosus]